MRIGVAILALATIIFLGWLGLYGGGMQRAGIELDRRQGAYLDPRRTIARIQSDLERRAAGHQAWPLPPGITGDALEAIVDAYRLYLDGNAKGMDARLKEIAAIANTRLSAAQGADADTGARALAYFTRLGEAAAAPQPTTRMLAGLRLVDGLLFLEAAHWSNADPLSRIAAEPMAHTWLRLPCRTVIGRVAALREAQAHLGELAGPMLACPSDNPDLAVLEAQAKVPAMLPTRNAVLTPRAAGMSQALPRSEPTAPPLPWDHDTAVAWMDEDPAAAEPVLAADTSPAGRLDLALFLHAFRPAGPDQMAAVLAAQRAADTAALARADRAMLEAIGQPAAYDGSDSSLLASLRLAVAAGAAPGYALPCAVLQARPGLLAATRPLAGLADDAVPRSGCAVGRGVLRGFPEAEVSAYIAAAEDADGHFLDRHRAPAALVAAQRAALEALMLAPRELAAAAAPALDHPYQVWGMASLANRAVERRILPLYQNAADRLAGWYQRQGLSGDEAARAAKTGLFRVVWGAQCGDGLPTPSLRALVLNGAPADDIRAALDGKEAPEVSRCAVHAGLDPVLLVAVGHAKALPVVLERAKDVDERNLFGKTALMVAAQNDLAEAARLLLDRGAAVNATTWAQDPVAPPLAHDGRAPLMYAAASGSLAMVKLLLERGADPHLADTRGRRAIDYLLGLGPVPANAAMSPEDRAEAARLLF